MLQEIEELWALADECREWLRQIPMKDDTAFAAEFDRLAKKLDDIAKRLAARLPT